MKTSLQCCAALAILGLAAAPVIAQTQTATSPSATSSPSATASATTSAAAIASPKATREASPTGGKPRATVTPVSPRHKGDQLMQGTSGESPAKTTGSPSSKKASKKSTSAESSAGSSASPSGKKSSHKKSSSEGAETSATPGGEQE